VKTTNLQRTVWTAMLAVLRSVNVSFAQSVTSAILGTLTDVSGAAITTASVIIVNQETGIEYQTAVGDSGEYTATNLPPGTYSVKTQLSGFRPTLVKDVVLLANRSARANLVLEPGSLSLRRGGPGRQHRYLES
jgi:hypothetical protein